MTTTPTLSGLVIGQAERATRAVLDSVLATSGTTFEQWVALRSLHVAGGHLAESDLLERMAGGLRVQGAPATQAIDQLVEQGLFGREATTVAMTVAGQARHDAISGALDVVVGRLYGDLPAEDLATAGRVLSLVTERAKAEVANSTR
jgi:DNA-binding MarR family transcriptional regulator